MDLDSRTVDLDLHLDLTVAGLVTSLEHSLHHFPYLVCQVYNSYKIVCGNSRSAVKL